MSKQTVVLQESGYDTGMEWPEYCETASRFGDDPRNYSNNIDNFTFTMREEEGWPEWLPVWEY